MPCAQLASTEPVVLSVPLPYALWNGLFPAWLMHSRETQNIQQTIQCSVVDSSNPGYGRRQRKPAITVKPGAEVQLPISLVSWKYALRCVCVPSLLGRQKYLCVLYSKGPQRSPSVPLSASQTSSCQNPCVWGFSQSHRKAVCQSKFSRNKSSEV